MTVLEKASDYIKSKSDAAFCDRCLSNELSLTTEYQDSNHANHKTTVLAKQFGFDRSQGQCSICKKMKKVISYKSRKI